MSVRLSGIVSGFDTEAMVKELMDAQNTRLQKIDNKKTKNEWTQEKWKDLNTKIYKLYTDSLSKMRLQSTYMTKKVASTNDKVVTASGGNTLSEGIHTMQVKQLASAQYTTGAKIDTDLFGGEVTTETSLTSLGYVVGDKITFTSGSGAEAKSATLEITRDTEIGDLLKTAREAGINANFDNNQKRLFFSSKKSGSEGSFTISAESASGQSGETGLEALGLGNDATGTAAQDAVYTYNGTEFTSSTNTISMNGLTMNLTGTTAGYGTDAAETVSLTITNDVDGVYNTVKDFIKSYNELIKEMNDAYSAASSKGYEPLSDDEKESMTDDQIEKWETKIKDSLLRNDGTLSNLLSSFKSALAGTVTLDEDGTGQKYSLAAFGIMTSTDYKEGGMLHIYGDSEDSVYSGKADKLKAALTNDTENTINALTKIFDNLYTTMQDKMKTTSLSGAMKFYNDKQLEKFATQYDNEYKKMQERLSDMEERYYKQFTAMEKAMADLQSQQNSLAGLFGTNK